MLKKLFFESQETVLSENKTKTWGRGYLKRATSRRTLAI